MTAQLSFFDPRARPARRSPHRRRALVDAAPLPERGMDDAAWIDALLQEYWNACVSAGRCKTHALASTTSGPEMGHQTELRNKHLIRQTRVKMALVAALRR